MVDFYLGESQIIVTSLPQCLIIVEDDHRCIVVVDSKGEIQVEGWTAKL
jgi:hypothetical protein